MSSRAPELAEDAFSAGLLIGVKASEGRSANEDDRKVLHPAILLSGDTLEEALTYKDRLRLFRDSQRLDFSPFRWTVDERRGLAHSLSYKQPDADTTYCVAQCGDDALLYIHEAATPDKWYMIGAFHLENLHEELGNSDFVAFQNLTIRDEPAKGDDNAEESDADYWNQYDRSDEETEPKEQITAPQVESKHDAGLTRVMIRSHVLSSVRDLKNLYEDCGKDTRELCQDLAQAAFAGQKRHNIQFVSPTPAAEPAKKHLIRAVETLKKLVDQLYIDKETFYSDIDLAIIELDPTFFLF